MPAPQAPVGCPPGLEYLTQIDQILVHQQIELFESETEGRVCVGVCAYVCACVCVCVCIHNHICDVGGMHARVHSLHLSLSPPVLSGWETANKYQIKNSLGQQVYFAAEGKRLLQRDPQSCNTLQPYLQNTVIYIEPSHLPCDTYVGVPCVCVCADSNCCLRQYCGPSRPFDMAIVDNSNREVIHLQRPLRCSSALCGFCCLQQVQVESPPGTVIGYVKQE